MANIEKSIQNLSQLARQFELTVAEYTVLHLVFLEVRPANLVVKYAMAIWNGGYGFPLLPKSDYDRALESLRSRELVQVIDRAAIDTVRNMLDSDPAIGPLDGLPVVGTAHPTPEGVTICRAIQRIRDKQLGLPYRFHGVTVPIYDENQCTIYSNYVCQAIRVARDVGAVKVTSLTHVGPWRYRWWEKFPSGISLVCSLRAAGETGL